MKVISSLVSGSVTGPGFASCWVLSKRGFGSVVALATWVSAHLAEQMLDGGGQRSYPWTEGRALICGGGARSPSLDLDPVFKQGQGHVCSSACVCICALVCRG